MDILPEEAIAKVDELGYSFLQTMGYDTEGAIESKEKRSELKKTMKKNGDELSISLAIYVSIQNDNFIQ